MSRFGGSFALYYLFIQWVYNIVMDVKRVDGIKFNFDRLTTEELETIQANLLSRHAQLVGDIALVGERLYQRHNENQEQFSATGPEMMPPQSQIATVTNINRAIIPSRQV